MRASACAVSGGESGADLAARIAAVGAARAVPGEVDEIARGHGADVVAGGRRRLGELDAELA